MIMMTIKPYLCNGCGACEDKLPGLLGKIPLWINTKNDLVDSEAVLKTVDSCPGKALRLEVV